MSPNEMQLQRDRALACAVLAVCITSAVFLSVFATGEKAGMENSRRAIALHEGLVTESATVLRHNKEALKAALAAYADLHNAHQR